MSKKEYFLIGLIVVLVGVYVVYFTDWFRPKVIRIEHSTRSLASARTANRGRTTSSGRTSVGNVTFSLHRNYKLTSIKVVSLADYQTNKYPHALWELVSKSGSQPIDGFAYGVPIRGMAPTQPDLRPEPLEPGVDYRLIVGAGSARGEHDFKIGASSVAGR